MCPLGPNSADRSAFTATFAGVFEHSPWVAERAFERGPFETVEELHAAMCAVVREAAAEEQLKLIRAHPDLVGRAALSGTLTSESQREQASAGLGDLSAEEIALFQRYNEQYKDRFGFPFIICARENKKESIQGAFPVRLGQTPEQEMRTALGEIAKIAWFRLSDLFREVP